MAQPETTLDYGGRLERVLAYLADNLDRELDLDRLADVACFSPFHFHRIFHALQGETVAESVRRMRLHRAAIIAVMTLGMAAPAALAARVRSAG